MVHNAANDNYIRTQNRSWLHNGYDAADNVEGTAVRKLRSDSTPGTRLTSRAQILKRNRALKRQKALFVVSGAILCAIIASLSAVLLMSMSTGNSLKREVSEKEADVEVLTLENDSREYDINSSVDYNEIIRAATQELGMVRSNASQIVTYSVKNSEYLQQVAQVPAK